MTVRAIIVGGMVLVLAVGCTHGPDTAAAGSQINDLLRNALARTASVGSVASRLQITWETGSQPFVGAQGQATLDFTDGVAIADLMFLPGGPMTVISTPTQFSEGHPVPKPGLGMRWLKTNLLKVSSLQAQHLPQIVAPGIDPFQLPALLSAVDWSDAIVAELPFVVADSSGQHVGYRVIVNTERLAQHATRPAKAWLAAMSKEPRGAMIALSVFVSGGEITSVSGNLPVAGLSRQADAKGKELGFVIAPLHAVIMLSLSYKKG